MEIVGAGFARTGTFSLKAALEQLGFAPCYHMLELIGHPGQVTAWEAAVAGDPGPRDAMLAGYRAAVDWPTCYFWRELAERNPAAKVILTVRDPDRWFVSHATLMRRMFELHDTNPEHAPDPRIAALVVRILIEDTYGGRVDDKDHCVEVFNRHTEEVRKALPPDRLLVFDVREGWEPLCAFLGVDVPADLPFPHLNEGAAIIDNVRAALGGRRPGH